MTHCKLACMNKTTPLFVEMVVRKMEFISTCGGSVVAMSLPSGLGCFGD